MVDIVGDHSSGRLELKRCPRPQSSLLLPPRPQHQNTEDHLPRNDTITAQSRRGGDERRVSAFLSASNELAATHSTPQIGSVTNP